MIRVIVGQPPPSPQILPQKSSVLPRSPSDEPRARLFVSEFVASEDVDWENVNKEELLSLANTETLFGEAQTFRFSGALSGARGEDFLVVVKELAASKHLFIFEEEKLLKGPTTALEKVGANIEIHKAPLKKERGFDPFGATTALAARSRKTLWLATVRSLEAGEKPEALAGLLCWKARQMCASGVSPKYKPAELRALSRAFVALYHDSHRGAGDLSLLLERFALTL